MFSYSTVSNKPSCVWVNNEMIDDRIDSTYYRFQSLEDLWKVKSFTYNNKIGEFFEVSKLSGFEYTDYFTQQNLKKGTIIALTSQNILENEISFDNVIKIPDEVHNQLGRSKILPNDILMSYTGQYRRACVASADIELHLGPNICRLRNSEENLDKHFISTYLNCKYGQSILDREKTVSAQPTVNMSRIREVSIPIPSSKIQKYIGDKVRKAEELREEAQKLKKEAEDILITEIYINQILEESNSINKKYMWVNNCDVESRIDSEYYNPEYLHYKEILKNNNINLIKINEISESIKTGTTPKSECLTEEVQKVLFLRVNNIEDSIINKKDILYLKNNYNGQKIKCINKNDILVSIAGTIGRSAVVDFENCITNQNVASITLNNSCNINPYYLSMYMNSYAGKLSLERISTQATVKYINNELLDNIEIPVINLKRQKEIEKKVLEYKNKKEMVKQLIQEAKQDVESLIEGTFDLSKINQPESR